MSDFVPEDLSRLLELERADFTSEAILDALRSDKVVLVKNATPEAADQIISAVAKRLNLHDQLELQAGYAAIRGHRERMGTYFMSVNKRDQYHFVSSHSEGRHTAPFQVASFYCYENSTDGGVTILQNVDEKSPAWEQLREASQKVDVRTRRLSAAEAARLRAEYLIALPDGALNDEDEIVEELPPLIAGVKRFFALSKLKKTYSSILGRELPVYWDSVASPDVDAGLEYHALLQRLNLLKEPAAGSSLDVLDNTHPRKVYASGVRYKVLFKAMIKHRLSPGDLLIQNNLTWTHSVSNWTPGSGTRKIAAAFA